MTRLGWPLVTGSEMRALDAHTIETLGVTGDSLMESAGRAVAQAALQLGGGEGTVSCLCGGGNNGGDGLVAARQLHGLGVPVRILLVGDRQALAGDAGRNAERAEAVGLRLEPLGALPSEGVLVDAVFGTGLARDVTGSLAETFAEIEARRATGALRVLAVDVPSGLCADTGRARGTMLRADATLTIGLPKLGLALEPGRSHAGRIQVARIGIADTAPGVVPRACLLTPAGVAAALPSRPAAGHKGSFGHALLVAGSEGKTGAAALAAQGAARVGAGLVTVGCPAGVHDVLEVKCTEAMTAPLSDTERRGLAASAEPAVLALVEGKSAMGLGPGIGREPETGDLVRAVAKRVELPLVLDADGLHAFASDPSLLTQRHAPTILTPHPGEAAALLQTTAAEVNADRAHAARTLAARTGAVVLLKGAASVTAEPEGRLVVNPTGGPALGSGGTGDVLLGVVVGLLAQGLAPAEAAALAAYVHGAAGDRWASLHGDAGLLASDLADLLPDTLTALRSAPNATTDLFAPALPER
jgi:NAD(P)H-hydrate epimerase